MKDLDGEISQLLQKVVDHFDKEDRATRERQIRRMRRLKLYWNSFSQVYWDDVAHDYRIFGQDTLNSQDSDQDYYDRPVNVFKAFLETIIAALSVQVPAVNCVPDDAESPLDLSTAKAGDKIAELIYKHNNVTFLWLHALYVYCTEGMIACYSYSDKDDKYGTYKKPKFENEDVEAYVCPACGERLGDEVLSTAEENEYAPDGDDVEIKNELEKGPVCPECAIELDTQLQKSKLIVPRLVGYTNEPKAQVCLEVYGGLYVKVANYAKKQCDTPYLNFKYETHYSFILEKYPFLRDKLPQGSWSNVGINDPYEQYGRLNTQYRGEFPTEQVTVTESWLRPAAFNILPEDDYKKLKKKFPDGTKVVLANTTVADYENQSLDDCWTLTENPMADFLNHDALGELLTNIQDIVNDLISLTLQTIEHGIAQTWADPAVVNFNAQRQIEAMPGTLTPTKPVNSSKNISDAFHVSTTASLSPEVFNFYKIVQELGQFVSGALPSLFGGQQSNSSRTASEYSMSRSMALQRLQTPWKMLGIWWKEIFGKVIPLYIKNIEEDERHVEKDKSGTFINVFIRKAELDGKIGRIELEPDDKLPITDEQQADMIMQLMNLNNEEIQAALLDPENIEYIKKVIKIPQFTLPGESDRIKQFEEINILINEVPIVAQPTEEEMMMAQQTGQPLIPREEPSVPIDPDVDNHQVEASICRGWLVSEAGRLAKIENEQGYKNVLLHMKAHMAVIQQQMTSQLIAQMNSSGQSDQKPKTPSSQKEKPKGEVDATPIS